MMRRITIAITTAVASLLCVAACGSHAATPTARASTSPVVNGKTLVVYYSYSGTTERVAKRLQQLTGGDLYELTLQQPYTGDSYTVSDRVFAERKADSMPALKGTLPNIANYSRVLIGTPVWNASLANPVTSYLQRTDFHGKTVAPFWTYITDEGTTSKDFRSQIKNANQRDGLPLRSASSMSDTELDKQLTNWLNTVG